MFWMCLLAFRHSLADADNTDEYGSYMQKHWMCKKCGESIIVTVAERLQHEQQCQQAHRQQDGTLCLPLLVIIISFLAVAGK